MGSSSNYIKERNTDQPKRIALNTLNNISKSICKIVYEINEKPTEKDAQLAALMEIENFLNKQEKSHELDKMIESVKKQRFGLIHVQLSLF